MRSARRPPQAGRLPGLHVRSDAPPPVHPEPASSRCFSAQHRGQAQGLQAGAQAEKEGLCARRDAHWGRGDWPAPCSSSRPARPAALPSPSPARARRIRPGAPPPRPLAPPRPPLPRGRCPPRRSPDPNPPHGGRECPGVRARRSAPQCPPRPGGHGAAHLSSAARAAPLAAVSALPRWRRQRPAPWGCGCCYCCCSAKVSPAGRARGAGRSWRRVAERTRSETPFSRWRQRAAQVRAAGVQLERDGAALGRLRPGWARPGRSGPSCSCASQPGCALGGGRVLEPPALILSPVGHRRGGRERQPWKLATWAGSAHSAPLFLLQPLPRLGSCARSASGHLPALVPCPSAGCGGKLTFYKRLIFPCAVLLP